MNRKFGAPCKCKLKWLGFALFLLWAVSNVCVCVYVNDKYPTDFDDGINSQCKRCDKVIAWAAIRWTHSYENQTPVESTLSSIYID